MGRRKRFAMSLLVSGTLVAVALWAIFRDQPPSVKLPQCGHWAIVRAAELVGVPLSAEEAYGLLPPHDRGHSVQQIADALHEVGVDAEVTREPLDSLINEDLPVIVHMEKPEHFIVVQARESEDRLLFADPDGNNRVIAKEKLADRATGFGIIVHGRRANSSGSSKSGPEAEFSRLTINEVGILPSQTEVRFEFPFQNRGNQPLIIKNVHKKCGCISAEYPKEPVAPGAKSMVSLVYRVDPVKPGFEEEAAVESNDPHHPLLMLRASGRMNMAVRINPGYADFGLVKAGDMRSKLLFVRFEQQRSPVSVDVVGNSHVTARVLSDEEFETRKIWEGAGQRPDELKNWPLVCVEITLQSIATESFEVEAFIALSTTIEGFKEMKIPVLARVVSLSK
ncbi:MAG: DUF1573 domain-containing protein [Planctomycetaceae bacterium]|nr:DUF1573 domain-containing protein [Planctomycetaceae bacterium]